MCQFIRAAIAKHQRPSAEQQYFLTILEAKNPRSRCADLVSSEAFIRHAVDHLHRHSTFSCLPPTWTPNLVGLGTTHIISVHLN